MQIGHRSTNKPNGVLKILICLTCCTTVIWRHFLSEEPSISISNNIVNNLVASWCWNRSQCVLSIVRHDRPRGNAYHRLDKRSSSRCHDDESTSSPDPVCRRSRALYTTIRPITHVSVYDKQKSHLPVCPSAARCSWNNPLKHSLTP